MLTETLLQTAFLIKQKKAKVGNLLGQLTIPDLVSTGINIRKTGVI
jgi:hypothetical protein